MAAKNKHTNIRQALTFSIVQIIALCILLTISVTTYLDITHQKKDVLNQLQSYAEFIAFNAQSTLLFDDSVTEEKRLKAFSAAPLIKNIHIYKVDPLSSDVSFFTSFNARNTPPVPSKIGQINQLSEPKVDKGYIEQVFPISVDNNTIGYAYIRGDFAYVDDYIERKLLIDLVIVLLVLVIVFIFSARIQKRFATPIERISRVVQEVARQHNYDIKAPNVAITELNQLSNHINVMLERTKIQIENQKRDQEKIEQLNQSLEEKVSQRTIALRDANQELLSTLERMHQYQGQIVENEKMASLGQMVAGVAHEVNTPIGLGITGSTLLKDRLEEVQTAFDNKTLSASQMKRFIEDGLENLELIYRNLIRAADLVSSFKKVAVNQDIENATDVNVASLIKEVMLTLKSELERGGHTFEVSCDENMTVRTKSGPIHQIIQQLTENALIHGFDGQSGRIDISVSTHNDTLNIKFKDNGKGIPVGLRPRIFDPFVTTKRGEGGSGLGLHLVYNLVTQALDGSINLVESEEQGCEFLIKIPINNA